MSRTERLILLSLISSVSTVGWASTTNYQCSGNRLSIVVNTEEANTFFRLKSEGPDLPSFELRGKEFVRRLPSGGYSLFHLYEGSVYALVLPNQRYSVVTMTVFSKSPAVGAADHNSEPPKRFSLNCVAS